MRLLSLCHMVVVAQLVELLVVVQEVAGSSPVSHPQRLKLDANELQESSCQCILIEPM